MRRLAWVMLCALCGCSALVSLDELRAASDAADGSTPESVDGGSKDARSAFDTTAPVLDAEPDDGVPEAAAPDASTLDSGPIADAADAAVPYCSSLVPAATFCDDFENGLGLWVKSEVSGTVTSQTAIFESANHAPQFSITMTNDHSEAYLLRALGSANSIKYTYSMYVPNGGKGTVEFSTMNIKLAGSTHQVYLLLNRLDTSVTLVHENLAAATSESWLIGSYSADKWQHVSLDMDLASVPPHVVVTIGALKLTDQKLGLGLGIGIVSIITGHSWGQAGTTPLVAYTDNVAAYVK